MDPRSLLTQVGLIVASRTLENPVALARVVSEPACCLSALIQPICVPGTQGRQLKNGGNRMSKTLPRASRGKPAREPTHPERPVQLRTVHSSQVLRFCGDTLYTQSRICWRHWLAFLAARHRSVSMGWLCRSIV